MEQVEVSRKKEQKYLYECITNKTYLPLKKQAKYNKMLLKVIKFSFQVAEKSCSSSSTFSPS